MNNKGEGEAIWSPLRSFKDRALYLPAKLRKFRIWYLYGLYKIEKALPFGKTKSMGYKPIEKTEGVGKAEVRTFPFGGRPKEKHYKNFRPVKGELAALTALKHEKHLCGILLPTEQ